MELLRVGGLKLVTQQQQKQYSNIKVFHTFTFYPLILLNSLTSSKKSFYILYIKHHVCGKYKQLVSAFTSICVLFLHRALWEMDGETVETVSDFIFGGSKITADGDFSHEIKRHLLLGRKVMTNLDSILKSRDITLPTEVHLVKAMVFPVVM